MINQISIAEKPQKIQLDKVEKYNCRIVNISIGR